MIGGGGVTGQLFSGFLGDDNIAMLAKGRLPTRYSGRQWQQAAGERRPHKKAPPRFQPAVTWPGTRFMSRRIQCHVLASLQNPGQGLVAVRL
jgi:hypothetical protein